MSSAHSIKLSEKEFTEMLRLIERYAATEMDQWELWKFDTEIGKLYLNISLEPIGSEDAYTEISHLLKAR